MRLIGYRRSTTKVASRFSQLGVMVPSSGYDGAPPSAGLSARDQIACVTQASTKYRKAQHDHTTLRHSLGEVNGDIRGAIRPRASNPVAGRARARTL
jgi:hypothetical protein